LVTSPGFGVQLDTFGLPIGIPIAQLFTSRDSTQLRFAFTLLGVSRIIPGWKTPNLDPVTRPGADFNSALADSATSTVADLGWRLPRPSWTECHVTTKAGPNAQALVSSIEDASLLTPDMLECLRVLGGDGLVRTIETIRLLSPLAWLAMFKLAPKGRLSRISYVKDKEAKCRIVAILDYWSQTALKPLHDAEMRFLKTLSPDCTFNQGSFRSKLTRHGPYHSCDLSNATDRMPVWLQVAVLSALISPEYAAAWEKLLTDRDYHVTWRRDQPISVRYGAGQPMGAYSSWATFALTHHVIVRMAAKRAGLPVTFSSYVLLGDDIVICDDAVALQYGMIMSELGVEISVAKTHVSNDTYEFAKRWISDGTEVTGAPLGSLFEAVRFVVPPKGEHKVPTLCIRYVSYYGLATWLREVEARWLPRSHTLVSRGLLARLLLLLGQGGRSTRLAEKAWRFFLLPVREDPRSLRKMKARILGSIVLSDILSCNSTEIPTRVAILLNECKARVLEEAIKHQIGDLQRFQLEMGKFATLVPEGLDAQSLLLLLPPFAVLRQNVMGLQIEFDKAHRVRESDSLAQWLHLDVRLFLNPFETLSTRASKTAAMSKATILNHVVAMAHGIGRMRDLALCGDTSNGRDFPPLEHIARTIQTHEVLPKPGRRRRSDSGRADGSKPKSRKTKG